jgi:membrane protease subunit HflK
VLDAAWQRMHWWIVAMAVLYAASGTTVVKPDEVAVILRWGKLVGDTPALQEHGPGLLFAFPRPFDRVVRVPVKRVSEVSIRTLSASLAEDADSYANTLDPVTQGYALTGDQNIVRADVIARYRIRDAVEWAFYGPPADDVLRAVVSAALVRSLGEMGVDRVLADGRKALVATATRRAQEGLDRSHAGLELTSLELTQLAPPVALAGEFEAVQSAYIAAETKRKDAQAFRELTIPAALAESESVTQAARGAADHDLATASGEVAAFLNLDREYRANPAVVRERLYRDAVEKALSAAGSTRWVPPPAGGRYSGFRVSISPTGQTAVPALVNNEEPH